MDKVKKFPNKHIVFFDFDNTITTKDVLDDVIQHFSKDDGWMRLEEKWRANKIGSRECLKGQMQGMRARRKELDEYLMKVKIDPYFKALLKFLSSKNIAAMILSDNFDYILKRILKNNNINNVKVYSNRLKIIDNRLSPSFPYSNSDCGDCGHCKKTTLLNNMNDGMTSVYIGDGLSDACVSRGADIVFAKGYLKKHCKNNGIAHIPFNELKDVYNYFKRSLL